MSDRNQPSKRLLVFAGLSSMLCIAIAALAPGASAAGQNHDFIGAEGCRGCHPSEFEIWSKGPHARAFDRLSPEDKKNPRCAECHTLVPGDPDPGLGGVQCESCHGAGRFYAKPWVMRDKELRAALNFDLAGEKTCARCHTDKTPSVRGFDFPLKAERIRHWQDK